MHYFCFLSKKKWRYRESKLRCVSSLDCHSHNFASTVHQPFSPKCSAKASLHARNGWTERQALALTAGTFCRRVRRLSPELVGAPLHEEEVPYVALIVNLPCISKLGEQAHCFYRFSFAPRGRLPGWGMRKQALEMAFPVRAVVVSTVAGGFLWFIGFPKWAAFLFSFLGFLGMGGLQYGRIVYRTFPRDLWWALIWVVVYVVFYISIH